MSGVGLPFGNRAASPSRGMSPSPFYQQPQHYQQQGFSLNAPNAAPLTFPAHLRPSKPLQELVYMSCVSARLSAVSSPQDKLNHALALLCSYDDRLTAANQQINVLQSNVNEVTQKLTDMVWVHFKDNSPLLQHIPSVSPALTPDINPSSPTPLGQYYHIMDVIGEGQFSKVHRCALDASGLGGGGLGGGMLTPLSTSVSRDLAVKVIKKDSCITLEAIRRIDREIATLQTMAMTSTGSSATGGAGVVAGGASPHVLKLVDAMQGPNHLFIITERLPMDLFEYMQRCGGNISEPVAAAITTGIVRGTHYMHELSLCHRDLKPENILIHDHGNSGVIEVKLADLGLAETVHRDIPLHTFCGSPGFFAPELLTHKEFDGYATDLWSVGCVALELLCPPDVFANEWLGSYAMDLLKAPKKFEERLAGALVDVGRALTRARGVCANDFVRCLVRKEPRERMSMHHMMSHPFVACEVDGIGKIAIPRHAATIPSSSSSSSSSSSQQVDMGLLNKPVHAVGKVGSVVVLPVKTVPFSSSSASSSTPVPPAAWGVGPSSTPSSSSSSSPSTRSPAPVARVTSDGRPLPSLSLNAVTHNTTTTTNNTTITTTRDDRASPTNGASASLSQLTLGTTGPHTPPRKSSSASINACNGTSSGTSSAPLKLAPSSLSSSMTCPQPIALQGSKSQPFPLPSSSSSAARSIMLPSTPTPTSAFQPLSLLSSSSELPPTSIIGGNTKDKDAPSSLFLKLLAPLAGGPLASTNSATNARVVSGGLDGSSHNKMMMMTDVGEKDGANMAMNDCVEDEDDDDDMTVDYSKPTPSAISSPSSSTSRNKRSHDLTASPMRPCAPLTLPSSPSYSPSLLDSPPPLKSARKNPAPLDMLDGGGGGIRPVVMPSRLPDLLKTPRKSSSSTSSSSSSSNDQPLSLWSSPTSSSSSFSSSSSLSNQLPMSPDRQSSHITSIPTRVPTAAARILRL